jgi:uncharacterized protein YndB with AHSA1/START domain
LRIDRWSSRTTVFHAKENVVKLTTFFVGTGLALFSGSAALAQQSSHLSAQYVKQATPLLHWPKGLAPRDVDVFVHNEVWINAPANVVWENLIDAKQWPSWYSNSSDMRLSSGAEKLGPGARMLWNTFGFPIDSTVDTFTPDKEIGWSQYAPGFAVHHGWVLVPERGGTLVITEEAQKGAASIKFRLEQPNAMYDGHDWWLSGLKARSEAQASKAASAE